MRSRGRRPRLRPEAQTELEGVDDGTDHQGLAHVVDRGEAGAGQHHVDHKGAGGSDRPEAQLQELKDLLPLDKSREDSDALEVYEELERSARGRGR